MTEATKEFLQQQEALYDRRREEIRNTPDTLTVSGTTYYVSADGDDSNDGKRPETAWKTLRRVSDGWFKPGDAVRFRRGDVFRGSIDRTWPGVAYGAYGSGPKPELRGWVEDLASPVLWELADEAHHIWKYTKPISDAGTLVFNGGALHSRKLIPSYINLQFVCRDDETRPFDMAQEMTQDLDLFWRFDTLLTRRPARGEDFPVPTAGEACFGELYLRCDRGNPGEVFSSIEAVVRSSAIQVGTNPKVTVDNLCMKYYTFGVKAFGHSVGLHVTNCEIGWIGGTIQHYFGTDPNYPQGRRGTVTRFGNCIEIYGGCEDYVVDNCYLYQCYDAGVTHQVSTTKKVIMSNIRYTNNLIETCVYGIEYFLDQLEGESESRMDGMEMSGNIIRLSGYGWGQQRHNVDTPALIKGWSYTNPAKHYTIHNNIFDRCAYRMLHLVAQNEASCPHMHDNTYIQHLGGQLGQYGANEIAEPENLVFDERAEEKISSLLGDRNAKVFVIR